MGFFSAGKKGISKKPVAEWSQEQVLRWLAYIGKEKYADNFRAVQGSRLLQLTRSDLESLTATKLDAELLQDAIAELRRREGLEPSLQPPAEPAADESAAAADESAPAARSEDDDFPADSVHMMKHLPPVNTSVNGAGKAATAAVHSSRASSNGSRTPISSAAASPHPKRGAAENAEVLSSLVGGQDVVNDLFAYMSFLGIQGMGLVEATERSPVVGHIIGALWELHDLVATAKGNRSNCLQLDAYGQDILRVFDAEGKRLAFISGDSLNRIMGLVEQGIAIVEACCKPGWLLRMASAERSLEEFQAVHNGILEKLRAEKVDTLPNGRQLTYGEYRDTSRPLRRWLKQIGSGALEKGLTAALHDKNALLELSQLIEIDKQAILKDLQHMSAQPELDLLSTQDHSHSSVSGEYSPMSPVAGRSKEYRTVFTQYDKNQSGALEFEELRSVLADLGLLDGIKPTEIEAYTTQQFHTADADQDGRVDYDEFVNFYQSLSTTKARRELRSALGPQAEKDLKKIFHSFASFGVRQSVEEMDGAKFSKLCRDCKLLGRSFTTIDVDLIFAKTKIKGQRRISFDGFLSALVEVAEKKNQSLDDVVRHILSAGGPTVTGTRAEYVKFHDDKSTYTGVYSRGGPTNVDPSKDLSSLLDRSEADVRGVKKRLSSTSGSEGPLSARGPPPARAVHAELPLSARTRRESSSGAAEYRPRSVSLTGESSSGTRTSHRLSAAALQQPPQPRSNGSGTPASRDGSHKSTADTPPPRRAVAELAAVAPEPAPKSKAAPESAPEAASEAAPKPDIDVSPRAPNEGSFCAPGAIKRIQKESSTASQVKVPKLPVKQASKEDLQGVFNAFATFGNRSNGSNAAAELDGAKFAKLCRESRLLDPSFTSTSVDIIFSKVKAKGARKIGFKDFERALSAIAAEKQSPVESVQQQIVAAGGPKRTGTTQTSHVRLHDDKANYTGVYKAGGPSVIDKHITLQSLTDRTNTQAGASRARMSL